MAADYTNKASMTLEADPGFWKQVSSWLWLAMAPLIALVWGLLTKRIDEAKAKADAALPKTEFEQYAARQREDIKELYGLNSDLKDHVNGRVETMRTDMHEAIGRLGDKMQAGFDALRKELTEVLKAVNKRRGD